MSAQLCLCQPSCTLREHTQIKYRFLEVANLDFSDLCLLGIFYLLLTVISTHYKNPSMSAMILHSGSDRRLSLFCVKSYSDTVNSHTNSNWLNENFYGLLLWLKELGKGISSYFCFWWVQSKFSKTVSVSSAETPLWSGIVLLWMEKSFKYCSCLLYFEYPSLSKHPFAYLSLEKIAYGSDRF